MVLAQRQQHGGGSVTRFAKVMKDGPDTKKLKAEKKELRKKCVTL